MKLTRRKFMGLTGASILTLGIGIPGLGSAAGKNDKKGSFVKITSVGHSTYLFDFGGTRVLSDPCFSETMGWPAELKGYRRKPLGVPVGKLPKIDVIVCTHRHPDHFDIPSLNMLNKNIPVFVADSWMVDELTKLGFKTITLVQAWDVTTTSGIKITATPAIEGAQGLTQVGYVLTGNGKSIYFGGDTMVFPEIDEIGKKYAIDLAMPPINGVKMYGKLVCMTSEEAADTVIRIKAKYAIPQHYDALFGAFPEYVVTGSPEKFADAVGSKSKDVIVKILDPGESFEI